MNPFLQSVVKWGRDNNKPIPHYTKDSQQTKVYRAENGIPQGSPLSLSETVAFVRKVETSAYVTKHYGNSSRRVVFTNQRRNSAAAYGDYQMNFAPCMATRLIILHEMAHGYAVGYKHSWVFCHVYLDLVKHFLGKQTHDALKRALRAQGCKVTFPAVRKVSPEQRAILVERMAKARAAKGTVSTGRYAVAVKQEHWTSYRLVSNVTDNRLSVTSLTRKALVRKTDDGIAKLYANVKSFMWHANDKVFVVDLDRVTPGYLASTFDPLSY